MRSSMGLRCTLCREEHEGLPDIAMHAPDPYLEVPESERADRTLFTPDRCTVRYEDGVHYFVRGVLYIPIIGESDQFGIGVWVSQSRANFERYTRRETMEPTFGWLANRIPHYRESTFLLKARVCFSGVKERPAIELEPTEHLLAVDQRTGITLARAWEIVHNSLPN